mmetsp:Transcript_5207/g.10617  ORF Transcript_5207/g.10617 Transcript_5207/m.10617 type:complete len:102 (+) Transcript_5207:88-393(+)
MNSTEMVGKGRVSLMSIRLRVMSPRSKTYLSPLGGHRSKTFGENWTMTPLTFPWWSDSLYRTVVGLIPGPNEKPLWYAKPLRLLDSKNHKQVNKIGLLEDC